MGGFSPPDNFTQSQHTLRDLIAGRATAHRKRESAAGGRGGGGVVILGAIETLGSVRST